MCGFNIYPDIISSKKDYKVGAEKAKLKLDPAYLLVNCYFTVGKSTFRQVTGIPMD